MPRIGRRAIPNCPHHVIHCGHNRVPVFVGHDDNHYYPDNLAEWKNKRTCKLSAYCLMTNHGHVIIGSGDNPALLATLVKQSATLCREKYTCRGF